MACVSVSSPGCASAISCNPCDNVCPDFQIKRNDTRPPFRVGVEDENGPIDFTGLVIEASMWTTAKLKANVEELDTVLAFADNIGFYQSLPNDIIVINSARTPEHMRITGFDEVNKLIFVERGFNNTLPQFWKKGTPLQIFRFMNAPAQAEMIFDNIQQVDGTTACNQLIESLLVYEWSSSDTCTPGCFFLEFKVLKMGTLVIPSVTSLCFSGLGVEWVRRYPTCNAFIIKICESPTGELYISPSTT